MNAAAPTRRAALLAGAAALLAPAAATAQGVALSGRMGERALLVIDGTPRAVAPGQTVEGVRFERWVGELGEIQRDGQRFLLRVGGTPTAVAGGEVRAPAREIALTAGPGGHFAAAGTINGRQVRFLVDTGATLVAIGRPDAERLGLDLTNARQSMMQSANGVVPVWLVTLTRINVAGLEMANVGAAVLPQPMPMVLLGNSFLSRVQMRRENDVMRLELR